MAGIVVTKHSDSITIDLGGASRDREKARIRLVDIRSITKLKDSEVASNIF